MGPCRIARPSVPCPAWTDRPSDWPRRLARLGSTSRRCPRSAARSASACGRTTGLRDLWVEGEVGRVTVSTAGHAYFALKDARSPAAVRLVPRRPSALPVPAADRAAGRRPRPDGRVRAAGRATAVRRLAPAVRVRRPRPPVRAAEGAPGRRRACSTPRASGRCRPGRATIAVVTCRRAPSGGTSATSSRGAGRSPGSARRLPGPGRRGAGKHRRRRSAGWSAGSTSAARSGRADEAPAVTILARGGGRSRTCGRSTTSASCGRSWRTRSRSCAASATRWTSRWPTSRPTCAHRPRRRRRSSSCPTGSSSRGARAAGGAGSTRWRRRRTGRGVARGRGGAAAPGPPRPGRPPRRVARARRPAPRPGDPRGRLAPASTTSALRPRSGLARRASTRSRRGPASPRARRGARRGARRRCRASGPQATLERGYAIVRRRTRRDRAAPGEAPAGTPLAVLVARGDLPRPSTPGARRGGRRDLAADWCGRASAGVRVRRRRRSTRRRAASSSSWRRGIRIGSTRRDSIGDRAGHDEDAGDADD